MAERRHPGDRAADAAPEGGAEAPPRPAVENRWWVDSGTAKRPSPAAPAGDGGNRPTRLAGERLFRAGRDFDQDRARARLTQSNLGWIREANPPENGWVYLSVTEGRSRDELVARVKHSVRLPRGARGVIVDSGTSLRAVVTGAPVGERIVEITLANDSSFDAWIGGEWVFERVYRGRDRALREASALVSRYLVPSDNAPE
ncbi:MAG TPA: hypothetical protein VFD92_03970 [Candidatus Binatia bacterium]|nr:hypothetical protein [Candidatus Binatia bacterium]